MHLSIIMEKKSSSMLLRILQKFPATPWIITGFLVQNENFWAWCKLLGNHNEKYCVKNYIP